MKPNFSSALVTGASGLLGKALVAKLVEKNIKVICLTRKTSNLVKRKDVEYKLIETFDLKHLNIALKNINVDVVFHLAAYGVNPNCKEPSSMFSGNIEATNALMLALSQGTVGRIIYTGSCSEYGKTEFTHLISEQQPLCPNNFYATAKAVTHLYCNRLAKEIGLEFITLRLFNIYGPGEAEYRLIPYLIKLLSNNKTVDLTPGRQVKDFLYIDDVISALIIAAQAKFSETVYNVCSSQPISIYEIATEVAQQLQVEPQQLLFGARPYREDEIMWLVGDNAKFRKETNWQPQVSLKSGIAKMIQSLA